MRPLYLPYDKALDNESGSWCLTGRDRAGHDFGVGSGATLDEAEGRLKAWVLDSMLASAGEGEDRLDDLFDAPPTGPAVEFGMADLIPIRLRVLRARRGLTQSEIGARLGLTQQAYAKLERPGANLQLRTLELVQGVLDADPLALQEGAVRARTAPARRGPARLITPADIVQWAQRTEAKAEFPLLMYRLIWGSSSRLRELNFPSGEAVYSGGFDGVVVASGDHPHIPDGVSVWELATERNVRAKAESDFAKRVSKADVLEPEQMTYIAVTARNSTVIEAWAQEKRALKVWKDVRGYDAGRLASWIDSLPAVAMWFAGLIGKVPAGVHDLASWWFDWSHVTVPATSTQIVLCGQEEALRSISDWAAGPPSPLAVRAATEEEALAVSVAALQQPRPAGGAIARAWIVTSRDAWTQITASTEPLILVAAFDEKAGVESAVSRGHHVLVPLDYASPRDDVAGVAARPREAIHAELKGMGVEYRQLDELAELARLSLAAFRRKLARIRGLMVPEWAQGSAVQDLTTILLAGGWDDNNPADRAAVERLADKPYDAILSHLRRWANAADPPVREVGSHWRLVDRMDAWVLLHRFIGREHLERWAQIAIDVLSELDPKFELSVEQQYAAAIYDKRLTHSPQIREGLAATMAVLGAVSETHPPSGQLSGQEWACRVVRSLLARPGGWHLWASLSLLLRLVAEACPDSFIRALDAAMDEPQFTTRMFTDQGETFFQSSPHTGLLWALEVLAWSKDHLGDATQLLGTLAATEPGGRLANRPVASLAEIYKIWHPCTSAGPDVRRAALQGLVETRPDVAWTVLGAILPQLMAVAIPTATPRWRNWTVESQATGAEVATGIETVVELLVELANGNGDRWASLIDLLDDVPGQQFDRMLDQLLNAAAGQFADEDRGKAWDRLRKVVDRHREFPDARWALPRPHVERMERVLSQIAPSDPVVLHGWLFKEWPEIPGRRQANWSRDQEEIGARRLAVIRDLLSADGVDGVLQFARGVEAPWTVGWTLVQASGPEKAGQLLGALLESDDDVSRAVGTGIVGRIASVAGKHLTTVLSVRSWQPSAAAEILRFMALGPDTWTLVDAQPEAVRKLYWERVNIYQPFPSDDTSLGTAVGALITHHLYEKAIHLVELNIDTASSELIVSVLTAAAFGDRGEPLRVGYIATDVPRLLEVLSDRAGDAVDTVAELEWVFLPLLHTPLHHPKALIARLQRDPAFFIRVLTHIYRRSDEEPKTEPSQIEKEQAGRAFDLLHQWSAPPGCHEDGTVDEESLRSWVGSTRQLAREAARSTVADIHIGQVLAYVPAGPNGWPPDVVGRILEDCRSSHLEEGLANGLHNRRGVSTRALREGGAQERLLAKDFSDSASRVSARFPRVARVLRQVAASYIALGRIEDAESELV